MKSASIYLGIVAAMAASACLAELQDENILTKLPDGFKIDFQQRNKDMLISEMVPVKQSVKNWTEMVTVQVFYGLKATPDQFKAKIESGLATACPKSESRPVAQGEENGYPSLVWLQNCPLNKATGKPEITWFKAIQGNDSFYIVQVAFKAWPSKEQISQWMRYLKERDRLRHTPAGPGMRAARGGTAEATAAAVGSQRVSDRDGRSVRRQPGKPASFAARSFEPGQAN